MRVDPRQRGSCRTVSHGRDPTASQGKDSSPGEVEENRGDELTKTPVPCQGEGGRARGGKGVLGAYFTSHYLLLILFPINSLCNFKLSLFCP